MSTDNLCFGAKIRKIGMPLHTPFLLYKKCGIRGYLFHGHVFLRHQLVHFPLRKLAHAMYRDFFRSKTEHFSRKEIDCGHMLEAPRGSSNEYPQSMFWIKNKKNRYTLANPCFSV